MNPKSLLVAYTLAGVFAFAAASQAHSQEVAFSKSSDVRGHPADMNNDGHVDMVDLIGWQILLGDGTRHFSVIVDNLPGGLVDRDMHLVDVDGNGRVDFLRGNTAGVGVSLQTGPLVFTTPFENLLGPGEVAVGDVNNDGIVDVVKGADARAFLGDGHGSFSPVVPGLSSSGQIPRMGDFNGDGNLDVVYPGGESSSLLYWHFGNGDGTFQPPPYWYTISNGVDIAVGDVDNDGVDDIAVGMVGGEYIQLFYLNESGGVTSSDIWIGSDPSNVALGDFNGDGNCDVVVGRAVALQTVLLFGDGTGIFPTHQDHDGLDYCMASPADLDEDGRTDLYFSKFVYFNDSQVHPGAAAFGMGTGGCQGAVGAAVNQTPRLDCPGFRLVFTNVPPRNPGLVLVGDVNSYDGFDALGIGLTFHVDIFGSTVLLPADAREDGIGTGFAAVPIPNDPNLLGQAYFAQSFWLAPAGHSCSNADAGLVSSRGLTITVAP